MRRTRPSANQPPSRIVRPIPGLAAILVSGGMDSCVLLADMARKYRKVFPLYVRTGMRWESQELRAARRFMAELGAAPIAPLNVLNLPMDDLAGDHWSFAGDNIPGYRASVSSNYILGRNLILLSKAAVFCAANRVGILAMAPLLANPFPDARPEFFDSFARTVAIGTGLKLKVQSPFAGLSKADIVRRGRSLPLYLTISCIRPRGFAHCGACTKCAERIEGFREAGVPDRTRYLKPGGKTRRAKGS